MPSAQWGEQLLFVLLLVLSETFGIIFFFFDKDSSFGMASNWVKAGEVVGFGPSLFFGQLHTRIPEFSVRPVGLVQAKGVGR